MKWMVLLLFSLLPLQMGEEAFQKQNYLDAIWYFEKASQLDPEDPRPQYGLTYCYQKLEQYERMATHRQRAKKLEHLYGYRYGSDSSSIYYELGRLHQEKREWKTAKGYFSKASPSYRDTKTRLEKIGQEIKKTTIADYVERAKHLKEQGNVEGAILLLKKALSMDPYHPQVLQLLRALETP